MQELELLLAIISLQIHMKPRAPEPSRYEDLFRMKLEQLINQRHELYRDVSCNAIAIGEA